MVDINDLAGKIFALLKGNGLQIKIYDEEGAETTDPSVGRRFFVVNPNIMITVDEENSNVEFNKGASVNDDLVSTLQRNIRRLADEFLMNSSIKVFGKKIQPKDYAYQAKMRKGNAMMEGSHVQPVNHHLAGEVMRMIRYFGGTITEFDLENNLGIMDHNELRPVLDHLIHDGKITASEDGHGVPTYSTVAEGAVMESTDNPQVHDLRGLGSREAYDKTQTDGGISDGDVILVDGGVAIMYEAWPAMVVGDFEGFHKFKDDVNPLEMDGGKYAKSFEVARRVHDRGMTDTLREGFSRMFGTLRTSKQTLENVRIVVRHKKEIDENVRGARSRQISAIFLECNEERFRFPYNYLQGARAMAQHLAHGGTMNDKVGSYILESVGNLVKLQSFNRYVTNNNLINEDSSGIVETVKENIETIRTELKKLSGVKTYESVRARIDTFEREALSEDDVTQLKELFTIRRFDEKFEEVLPIIKQLVQEKDTYHKRIEESASKPITLRRESINTTPMFEFASENAKLGFKLSELSLRIVENDELAGFINKIGTKLCKEGAVNDFERAILKMVLENARIEERKEVKKEIQESMGLESFFDKYDYKFL